jgi:ribonuclease PH
MIRSDRAKDALRPVSITRNYTANPDGSVLVAFGDTRVLCTATVDENVPPFLRDTGKGWVTAEYAMLPGSASGGRIRRDANQKGRALEISRLIGRSLRSVVNFEALGERQIIIDCDVLQADGGTRTAAITGGYVALADALAGLVDQGRLSASPMTGQCAAVSVGIVEGDLNLVMLDTGGIIEVQGTAEGDPYDRPLLDAMLDLGENGIRELFALQRESLDRA